MGRSNLIRVIVETPDAEYPDDGLTILDVQGDEERVGYRLSDVEWFREEFSAVGDSLLFENVPIGKGKLLLEGYLTSTKTYSYDYGEDFEVEWETTREQNLDEAQAHKEMSGE